MNSQRAARQSVLLTIGIYPPLAWGFVGLLLFMIGDGVEAGYLSLYLQGRHLSAGNISLLFTVYGITASISAWFSGALSDILGPRRVMWIGLSLWVIFEVLFLLAGVLPNDFPVTLITYGLRGFAYPLFAYGFLIWVAAACPPDHLGAAVGWFWFAFTGGLPTLGSLVASFSIPRIGEFLTFWVSLGLVIVGGLMALLLIREKENAGPLAPPGERPFETLIKGVLLAFRNKKLGIGCIVRAINTAPEFGFLVFLPAFFTRQIGFSLGEWLRLLSLMFLSNIVWNLLFGLIGDKFGWRRTVAYCGGFGCTLTTLGLYYVPLAFGSNRVLIYLAGVLYGATLAGYVPLSALMPNLEPHNKGAAMSILNLGAGLSTWVGPALVGALLPHIGVLGMMWSFAGLYLLSGILALFLKLPRSVEVGTSQVTGV